MEITSDDANLIYCVSGWYPYADSYFLNNTIINNRIIGTHDNEILKVYIQQGGGSGSTTIENNTIKNNFVQASSGTLSSYRYFK